MGPPHPNRREGQIFDASTAPTDLASSDLSLSFSHISDYKTKFANTRFLPGGESAIAGTSIQLHCHIVPPQLGRALARRPSDRHRFKAVRARRLHQISMTRGKRSLAQSRSLPWSTFHSRPPVVSALLPSLTPTDVSMRIFLMICHRRRKIS